MSLRYLLCPKPQKGSSTTAIVTLINILEDISVEDNNNKSDEKVSQQVEKLVQETFKDGLCPEREKVINAVLRFRKNSDRLLQLCSRILKSSVYHIVKNNDTLKPKKYVELPRSKYGKPYIPSEDYEISLSHQYPYIGIVSHASSNNPIGLDIVVMKDIDLKAFDGMFTSSEWLRINHDLHTFYIYWSMKEAYTKALGLGMSLNFNSFELHLPEHVTWDYIRKNPKGIGVAVDIESSPGRRNSWFFFFYPLMQYQSEGCVCICVNNEINFIFKWTKMSQMIKWHNGEILGAESLWA